MLEKVARDQVIRGYFSNDELKDNIGLNFNRIREETFNSPDAICRSTSYDSRTPTLELSDK